MNREISSSNNVTESVENMVDILNRENMLLYEAIAQLKEKNERLEKEANKKAGRKMKYNPQEILSAFNSGLSVKEIKEKFSCSISYVYYVLKNYKN